MLTAIIQLIIATLSKDSVDAVEEMLKKQEDFEKMLAGQEEKFHMLIRETKVKVIFNVVINTAIHGIFPFIIYI